MRGASASLSGREREAPALGEGAQALASEEAVLQGLIYARRLLERPEHWLGGGGHWTCLPAVDKNGCVPTLSEYLAMREAIAKQLVNGVDELNLEFRFSDRPELYAARGGAIDDRTEVS